MLSEVQTKSANFLRIVSVLRRLRKDGTISAKEYNRAKKYYQQLKSIAKEISDENVSYNEEYHLTKVPSDIKALYNSLKDAACKQFDLSLDPRKLYIASWLLILSFS